MIHLKSLKARILLFMGILIIVLLMLISISVLFRWRAMILDSQRQNALSMAQTFSLSLLDALIYQESGLLQAEGLVENHMHNFLKKNPQVKFIELYDSEGRIIVRSHYGDEVKSTDIKQALANSTTSMRIYKSPIHGLILEIILPLQIHSKSWGILKMGFDAEDMQKRLKQLFFLLLALTVIFLIVVLSAIYFRIDRLTRSLRKLVSEMNRFDLQKIEPLQMTVDDDEVGFLVTNFEKMKDRLAQSRKQLIDAQRQVHQAEKLASIGRLASGVAHEINNPLHGLKSCLYTIEKEPHNLDQLHKYLSLANEAIDHIAAVVQKLLGFSRQRPKQITSVDLNSEIQKVLPLLQYRMEKEHILLQTHLAESLPRIHADPHLIQEVIMNLLLNAIDSIQGAGKITVTTANIKDRVLLTITDTGCGIAEEHLDKIFDPFFTTKEEGKGTGLGLSVTLGIVEAHGGTIEVESKTGEGSTFRVYLPSEERS